MMTDGEIDIGLDGGSDDEMVEKAMAIAEEKERVLAKALVPKVRTVWGQDGSQKKYTGRFPILHKLHTKYLALSRVCLHLGYTPWYVNSLTVTICCAGALVGIQCQYFICMHFLSCCLLSSSPS